MIIDNKSLDNLILEIKNILEFLEKCKETNQEESEKISIRKPFAENYRLTQGFGENPDIYKKWGYAGHFGLDWALPIGTALLACDNGSVKAIGYTEGNGNFIRLQHKWGESILLHMREKSTLQIGETVEKGQFLGWSGNTGFVIPAPTKENPNAGAHTHFSIKIDGVENKGYNNYVDPTTFFDN